MKFKRGFYQPRNPEKYIQPFDKTMNKHSIPEYRSGWEKKFMEFCDANPSIVKWCTEPFCIKYFDPSSNKERRYFVDGFIEFQSGQKFIVEIKPYKESIPPKLPKKVTQKQMQSYQKALLTYNTNQAKWKAASEFANQRGIKFIVLTENELF